eukprot:1191942-Prorocentrum_minimum.AAC.1
MSSFLKRPSVSELHVCGGGAGYNLETYFSVTIRRIVVNSRVSYRNGAGTHRCQTSPNSNTDQVAEWLAWLTKK